jgi:hypothetical protein
MFNENISDRNSKPAGIKAAPRGAAGGWLRLDDFRINPIISVASNLKEEFVDEI